MTSPVIKKQISAQVSEESLTRNEKIGGTKKKFKQRSAITEITAEETKSPLRDCNTTIIRYRKAVTVSSTRNPKQIKVTSPTSRVPGIARMLERQKLWFFALCTGRLSCTLSADTRPARGTLHNIR